MTTYIDVGNIVEHADLVSKDINDIFDNINNYFNGTNVWDATINGTLNVTTSITTPSLTVSSILQLNSLTASRVIQANSSKQLESSSVTTTELGYLSGVTSSIQTQFSSKSPLAGSLSITTLGTITTGTWNGSTISPSYGGTGAGEFTQGSIPFSGASGVYTQDNSNLFWDNTNKRLGIGTNSPSYKLHVVGTAYITGRLTAYGNEVFCGDGTSDSNVRWVGPNNWEGYLNNTLDYWSLRRNSIEFFKVNSTGQLSIGGSAQSGYGLTVASSTGLYVDGGSGSNGLMVYSGSTLYTQITHDSATNFFKFGASKVNFEINGTAVAQLPSDLSGLNLGTGKLFFGSSISGQDTNLYRSAADTLKTDDSLIVGTELTVNAQPRCRVYNSSSQSIANSTSTILTFDTEEYDDGGCHSTSSNTSRLTAPSAGMYLVTARVTFQITSGTGDRIVYLLKNGTVFDRESKMSVPASKTIEITITSQIKLAAGDYVEVLVYQSSGVSISAVGSTIPYEPTNFSFVKLN